MIAADYTIQGLNIPLLFNNRTFRLFSEKLGVEQEDLYQGIIKSEGIKAKALPVLLLVAHESYCKYNNLPFQANELDADLWMDQMEGYRSEQVAEMYIVYVSKLTKVPVEKLKAAVETVEVPEEEKKSETKSGSLEHGTTTTLTPQLQD